MAKWVLISVYDKSGIVEFAGFLKERGYSIVSTGSTAIHLKKAGIRVTMVEDYTGIPEMFSGRVKTLHPKIHGGILFRRNEREDVEQAANFSVEPIDVVVVNLYPFERVAGVSDDEHELVENIDIGGPALLRAAAKNFESVLVVCDPQDYGYVMKSFDRIGVSERRKLAMKAFSLTAFYDSLVVKRFGAMDSSVIGLPMRLKQVLRYGENPHQGASFWVDPLSVGLSSIKQLQGKELSYNNILDVDVVYRMMLEFGDGVCTIVKHTTPCGVAVAGNLFEAYKGALRCDPVSAFGGIIGLGGSVDAFVAREIVDRFFEVVVAFGFDEDALEILSVRKNLRLLMVDRIALSGGKEVRSVLGGYLVQDIDVRRAFRFRTVSNVEPGVKELEDLEFAFRVAKFAKSNAVVFARGGATLAIGSGQTSRIDALRFASERARELGIELSGSVMASDGFFPFRDSIDHAARLGVKAVVEPGGSIRDRESIEAANEHGIALVFTDERHFRH